MWPKHFVFQWQPELQGRLKSFCSKEKANKQPFQINHVLILSLGFQCEVHSVIDLTINLDKLSITIKDVSIHFATLHRNHWELCLQWSPKPGPHLCLQPSAFTADGEQHICRTRESGLFKVAEKKQQLLPPCHLSFIFWNSKSTSLVNKMVSNVWRVLWEQSRRDQDCL